MLSLVLDFYVAVRVAFTVDLYVVCFNTLIDTLMAVYLLSLEANISLNKNLIVRMMTITSLSQD